MLTSNVQLGYVLTRGGGQAVQGGLSCPPPRISVRIDNPQILLHHLLQEYFVERDINFISVNLRCLLQTFSWVMYWQGVGGKLSRAVYLAPHLEFQREWWSPNFITPEIFSWERYKLYFSQSEMLTSNVSWVTYWQGVGGKLSRAVYLAPRPEFQREWIIHQQFWLHHLLQKYLVERDINFISVNLRCLLQTFSWVMYWQGVGGKLSRAVYLAPHLEFQRELIIPKFYYTICYRNICWKRYKHYFSQSEMLTSNVQLGYILTGGGGQAVLGGLSCPPT